MNKLNENENLVIAKADSGATAHYWRLQDTACLHNIKNSEGPTVQLPNGTSIKATQEGYLNISNKLQNKTSKVTILPQLKSASLLSLGKFCDDNCTIALNKHTMNLCGSYFIKGLIFFNWS